MWGWFAPSCYYLEGRKLTFMAVRTLRDQRLKIRATFSIDRPPTYAVMIVPIQSATMPVMGSVVPRPSNLSQTITFQR